MGLVATSFYTLSKHISIFRRFHLSYKAQKEKRPLLSQDRFLAKIAIVFSARRIPAVFLINSAPRSMRRQNASMLVRRQLRDLDSKIGVILQPIFVSKKLEQDLKAKEIKPSIVSQHCVVYKFVHVCDLCVTAAEL